MGARPQSFRRNDCRLCGSADLALVLQLTPTPPANAIVSEAERNQVQETFPIAVLFCRACSHVQLRDVVDPKILFENYRYMPGVSPAFVRHFRAYADFILKHYPAPPKALVVDIGSNDGTLLSFFQKQGFRVLGVDPARDIAKTATQAGIETLPEFFTGELARRIRAERGPAAVITANNVMAHIDDLGSVVDAVRELLADDGVFVFEVSYLLDVLDKTLFDTIYHEHLDYHSVRPLVGYFQRHGMALIAAERVDSHGGSVRLVAQRASGRRPAEPSLAKALAAEAAFGLEREATLLAFSKRIDALKQEFVSLLRKLHGEGKRIAAFGAPAKATTLMYHFGIGPELIEFVVEDSPLKQGMYTPGLHIPIVSPERMYRERPDYLVVLAWNFAEPIMAKHQAFREQGGRFIVPVPKVSIH